MADFHFRCVAGLPRLVAGKSASSLDAMTLFAVTKFCQPMIGRLRSVVVSVRLFDLMTCDILCHLGEPHAGATLSHPLVNGFDHDANGLASKEICCSYRHDFQITGTALIYL